MMSEEMYYRYGYTLAKMKQLCALAESHEVHDSMQRCRRMRKILFDIDLQRYLKEDYTDECV